MEELQRLSVEAFRESDKHRFVFVLDDVRSLNNVGSIFRTADAFGAKHLYLCGLTGTPPHRDIAKTALGAEESMAWTHEISVGDLLQRLKKEGYQCVAIEQVEGSISLQSFMPQSSEYYAFVLGHEVFGVNEAAIALCDMCVEIPQYGTKHSLNVAVTAGVVAWDFVSKLQKT